MIRAILRTIDCLNVGARIQLIGLLVLILIKSLLNAASVVLVLPFLSLVLKPELLEEYPHFKGIIEKIELNNHLELITALGFGIVVFYAFTLLFNLLVTYVQSRFWRGQDYRLGARLLMGYMQMPYVSWLNVNTATLYRNVSASVTALMSGLNALLLLVSDTIFVGATLVILFSTLGSLTLVVSMTLGGLVVLVYLFTKRIARDLGQRQHFLSGKLLKAANESLQGSRDIKIFNVEDSFVDRYKFVAAEYANVATSFAFLSQLPRYVIEVIMVFLVVGIVFFVIYIGEDFISWVPSIGLLVAAAYKLLPALSSIASSVVIIRNRMPAIEEVHKDLFMEAGQRPIDNKETLTFSKNLRLADLSFKYPDGTRALKKVTIDIVRGSSIGIIGRSGSGKSTLVDILLGLLSPQTVTVLIDGERRDPSRLKALNHIFGYVPQSVYLIDDTIVRNIAFGLPDEQIDYERVRRSAEQAQLFGFIEKLDRGFETVVGERGIRFSGGQRQRLGIARALYHDQEILVLDEATSALDGFTEREFTQELEVLSRSKTIIIIAHRMSTIRRCDVIYFIDDGAVIASGTHDELYERSKNYRDLCESMKIG